MAIIIDTTSLPGQTIVYDDSNGGVTIVPPDYSDTLSSIKDELVTMNATLVDVKNYLDSIASHQSTIAAKQTAIETYQKRLKELGETTGIHVIGPYDWLGLINIYRSLIEEGNITDTQGHVDEAAQQAAKDLIATYVSKIQQFPTGFAE